MSIKLNITGTVVKELVSGYKSQFTSILLQAGTFQVKQTSLKRNKKLLMPFLRSLIIEVE